MSGKVRTTWISDDIGTCPEKKVWNSVSGKYRTSLHLFIGHELVFFFKQYRWTVAKMGVAAIFECASIVMPRNRTLYEWASWFLEPSVNIASHLIDHVDINHGKLQHKQDLVEMAVHQQKRVIISRKCASFLRIFIWCHVEFNVRNISNKITCFSTILDCKQCDSRSNTVHTPNLRISYGYKSVVLQKN